MVLISLLFPDGGFPAVVCKRKVFSLDLQLTWTWGHTDYSLPSVLHVLFVSHHNRKKNA